MERKTFNLCKLVRYANCNFELNKSNTKETVNHLVSQHNCVRSKSHEFQMKLSNFQKGTKPLKSSNIQVHIWTPIIANLKGNQGFLLIIALINEASFGMLTLYLPCKNENWALITSPVEIKFLTGTGDRSKYSFIQSPTTLAKLDEFDLSTLIYFQSSSLNSFVEVDGSLLVNCQIRPVHQSKKENPVSATPLKVELGREHAIPLDIEPNQIQKVTNLAEIKIWSKKALQTIKTGIAFLCHNHMVCGWRSAFLLLRIAFVIANLNRSLISSFLFSPSLDPDIVYEIVHKGDLEEFQVMLKTYPSMTNSFFFGDFNLLQIALLDRNRARGFAKVRFLVEEMGADLEYRNEKNQSVLHFASKINHVAALELFLEKGLDPNVPDGEGYTPFEQLLMHFTHPRTKEIGYYDGLDTIEILFKYGVDCKKNEKSLIPVEECLLLREVILEK